MEKLKNLAILIVVIVVGYFAYQHFFANADFENEEEEYIVTSDLPPIPKHCQGMVQDVENAIYGVRTGQSSVAQKNRQYGRFADCLMEEGFSKAEVRGTIAQIEDKINSYE